MTPTEPGWITQLGTGVVEFWPASEWEMEDETDSGDGWRHWLVPRSEKMGYPLHSFGRGYRIRTVLPSSNGVTIINGWHGISPPPSVTDEARTDRTTTTVHTDSNGLTMTSENRRMSTEARPTASLSQTRVGTEKPLDTTPHLA